MLVAHSPSKTGFFYKITIKAKGKESSKKHKSVRSETKVEQLWTKDEEEEETKTKRRSMMIGEVASLPEK